jgi:hypothetical protein
MCQIQIIKRLNGKNVSKEDLNIFGKMMYLGNAYNNDAFGLFNHDYSFKAPNGFKIDKIDDRKLIKGNFIVGHNRLATSGKCYTEEIVEKPSQLNSFPIMNMNLYSTVIGPNPFMWNWQPSSAEPYTKDKGDTEGLLGCNDSDGEIEIKIKNKNYNNHPFEIGDFLLVHNGIVWNDEGMRKRYNIQSEIETDSYVILWMINHFFEQSIYKDTDRLKAIVNGVRGMSKVIKGTFSIVLYDKFSDSLIHFRSPGTNFSFYQAGNLILGSTESNVIKLLFNNDQERKLLETKSNKIYLVTNDMNNPIVKIGDLGKEEGVVQEVPQLDVTSNSVPSLPGKKEILKGGNVKHDN